MSFLYHALLVGYVNFISVKVLFFNTISIIDGAKMKEEKKRNETGEKL